MSEPMKVEVNATERAIIFPAPVSRIEFFQIKLLVAEVLRYEAAVEQKSLEKAGVIQQAPAGVLDANGKLRS